jgi:hypothetical protein
MKKTLAKTLGAKKGAATLLVLFIPSVDRFEQPIDQETWVDRALNFLGSAFGGATAFPKAKGAWRDDDRANELVFDEPVIINCYTSEKLIEEQADELKTFLLEMGTETQQGAVGLVIDRDYLEIAFPLEGQTNG